MMPYVIGLVLAAVVVSWLYRLVVENLAVIGIITSLGVLWAIIAAARPKRDQSTATETLPPTGAPASPLTEYSARLPDWQRAAPDARLLLRYRDDEGVETERSIVPKAIAGTASHDERIRPHKVFAFCELRRETRTFRIDQMLSVRHAATDTEVLDLYGYFGSAQPGGCPPKREAWSRPAPTVVLPAPQADLLLRYRDSKGMVADHVVRPRELRGKAAPDGSVLAPRLHAYCRQAKAPRTFVLSQVECAALAETGEIIDSLPAYLGLSGNGRR